MTTLLAAVRRHAEAHGNAAGIAATPIPGLSTVRATAPSGLLHDVSRPLVCLVLQGGKQVTMGTRAFAFGAGDSLLITADVPTVSQITRATVAAPYLSLVLELDPAVIADLGAQMPADALRVRFPTQVKIGPVERIRDLVNLQLPGVTLRPLPVAPRQIPYHAGFNYFELETRGNELWKQLETSGGLAMHIAGDFPGLELQFWAIRA